MAQQTVNIGTSANDGTGDPLRTAFDKVNDNFNEVYADKWVSQARIGDNVVDFGQLDGRFNGVLSNSSATGTVDLDFSSYATFKLTLTGNTTLTFSNVHQGDVKNIIVTGAFTLTLPSGTLTNGVAYDGASSNLIQVIASESTVFHYSISQGTTVTLV